jgi:hypothetical protein
MKHNVVVRVIKKYCALAMVPAVLEPRDLQAYVCRKCGEEVAQPRQHECGGYLDRTGPDLRIFLPDRTIVVDVTIAHLSAPSYEGRQRTDILAKKIAAKHALYDPMLGDEVLVVLPFSSHGAPTPTVTQLVSRLVTLSAGRFSLDECLDDLSASIARFTGETLCLASRRGRLDT